MKEEIKQAIRRQISRSNEPLDELCIKFLTQERGHILQALMWDIIRTKQCTVIKSCFILYKKINTKNKNTVFVSSDFK